MFNFNNFFAFDLEDDMNAPKEDKHNFGRQIRKDEVSWSDTNFISPKLTELKLQNYTSN